ncbi:MAG: transporter substrate-binding domain-containing protein [Candidatus Pseudomonas colombiensis]|nr:MAG: transporter substrate-binding domain-containing protein [Pseudomonas sp.]
MRDARSGQYSGYFVDLCRDFGERVLKVKVEFVDTNWDNLVAGPCRVANGTWPWHSIRHLSVRWR